MNKRVREDLLFPQSAVALYLHSGSGRGGAGAGGSEAGTQGERLLVIFPQGPRGAAGQAARGCLGQLSHHQGPEGPSPLPPSCLHEPIASSLGSRISKPRGTWSA